MNKKKNGFTLIELLAVIIILGILMIIAIPSVTKYISDSRKSAYVDTVKEIISGARNFVNEGKVEMYDTSTTYYIDYGCVKTENASKSPYGDFVQAYIGVTYDGTGYKYYWISADDAGQGIDEVTALEDLDIDDIKSDLNPDDILDKVRTTGIDGRGNIKILNPNGEWEDYSADNSGGSNSVPEETIDSTNFEYVVTSSTIKIGSPLPDDSSVYDNPYSAFSTFGGDQTVAVVIENGVVSEAYITFLYEDEVYYLRGCVDESNSSDTRVYNMNRKTSKEAFGESVCGDYSYGFSCENNNWNISLSLEGYAEASYYGFGCFAYERGEINCW